MTRLAKADGVSLNQFIAVAVAEKVGVIETAEQTSIWAATSDLGRNAAHPFYTRLSQILDTNNFDGLVEERCQQFYADDGDTE